MPNYDDPGVEMILTGDSDTVVFLSERVGDEEFIVAKPDDLVDMGEMQ